MTAVTHDDIYKRGAEAPVGDLLKTGTVLAVIGMGVFAFLVNGDDPGRAWSVFLVNFLFFTGVSMGAIVFSAVQVVVNGKWAGSIIRFGEAATGFLPLALLCFFVIFLGRDHLFPWIEHPTPVRGKWLTVSWVFWRDLLSLLVLFWLSFKFVINKMKPDLLRLRGEVSGWKGSLFDRLLGGYKGTEEQDVALTRKVGRLAPILILAYVYGLSVIAFDLIMSLAPWWMSNLLGAYYFMGSLLTGLGMLGLMTVYWRYKLGMQAIVPKKVFHDLGKLVFGFTIFWAYLTYSQFLVIWYGNLPEETGFIFYRLWDEWRPIGVMVGMLVFLIPFWGLIWVKSKVNPVTFTIFLTISLMGMWLERYLMVQPSLTENGPAFGLPEIGVTMGFLGLFLLGYGLFARALPMVSPQLSEKALAHRH